MNRRSLNRFSRYTLVGGSTFALDLVLLWILIEYVSLPTALAAALAFFAAVSLNYTISRSFAFRGTERTVWDGYKNFIGIGIAGALFTGGFMWLLTSYTTLPIAHARVLVALLVGIANYLINLYFNFRVAGMDL